MHVPVTVTHTTLGAGGCAAAHREVVMRGTVDSYSTKSGKRWRIRWDLPPDPETGAVSYTHLRAHET